MLIINPCISTVVKKLINKPLFCRTQSVSQLSVHTNNQLQKKKPKYIGFKLS